MWLPLGVEESDCFNGITPGISSTNYDRPLSQKSGCETQSELNGFLYEEDSESSRQRGQSAEGRYEKS